MSILSASTPTIQVDCFGRWRFRFYSFATITPSPEKDYRFVSENFEAEHVIEVAACSEKSGAWCDYPVAILQQSQAEGPVPPPGFHRFIKT